MVLRYRTLTTASTFPQFHSKMSLLVKKRGNSNESESVYSIFHIFTCRIVPAYAQTNADNVVINEVDINPPGDDSASISEWVEPYNPTDSEIDLSGWQIASTYF